MGNRRCRQHTRYQRLRRTRAPVVENSGASPDTSAPHDLSRFAQAQADVYELALAELKSGQKRSHWMWFIFPQIDGLGSSPTARRYAIRNLAEAKSYLAHPVLGPRLLASAAALLEIKGRSAREILGSPDDLKLRSCATLFAQISPSDSVFHRLLDQYFQGQPDRKTLELLGVVWEDSGVSVAQPSSMRHT